MVNVAGGPFWMGCNAAVDDECNSGLNLDEVPYHEATLSAFEIARFPVTMGEFAECVDAAFCTHHMDDGECEIWKGTALAWVPGVLPEPFRGETKPMVCVDWGQAAAYCGWAGGRLPTEAEWEKAARGVDGRKYPWGNTPRVSCDYAVMRDLNAGGDGCGTGATMDVGSRPIATSPFCAEDMIGNVWQWVADWYSSEYFEVSPTADPKGPETGTWRVIRGSSWDDIEEDLRASNRFGLSPDRAKNDVGFRCAD
jgi:formylglycine-generating enzyme required for sulfatase activity